MQRRMNHYPNSPRLHGRVRPPNPALFLALLIWLVLGSSGGIALAQTMSAVAQIKADFDTAMGKPLAERVPDLEALEQRIAADLFEGRLTGKQKVEGLYYQYHTRLQLAKYDEAAGSYGDYLKATRDELSPRHAESQFVSDIATRLAHKEHVQVDQFCTAVLTAFPEDTAMQAAALYHQAKARYRLNGMLEACGEACRTLIAEHPRSPWRDQAMRLLANVYYGQAKYDEALATLSLLKQQYPNTKLEHYADMRPAAIWESRGEPQKALEIYQQTLQNHPDHFYATYIRSQMERLREVIEKQLIQDALEGLGRKAPNDDAPERDARLDDPVDTMQARDAAQTEAARIEDADEESAPVTRSDTGSSSEPVAMR